MIRNTNIIYIRIRIKDSMKQLNRIQQIVWKVIETLMEWSRREVKWSEDWIRVESDCDLVLITFVFSKKRYELSNNYFDNWFEMI